jgi:hypothetical protein
MYSTNSNHIQSALMLRYDRQIDQHKNLNPETSRDLERLSRRLASNPTGTRLSFTTGV